MSGPRRGLNGSIQPEGFVAIVDDPGRADTFGAPASMKPVLEPKAPFIQGNETGYLLLSDDASEVFLNASCCC